MINPAAVTLLVGIFTFCEVVFLFPGRPPKSEFLKDGGGYRLFVSAKDACKGIGKYQLQRTNSEIFATHPFFFGDKLCTHAATPAFYQS